MPGLMQPTNQALLSRPVTPGSGPDVYMGGVGTAPIAWKDPALGGVGFGGSPRNDINQTDYTKPFGPDNSLPGQQYFNPIIDKDLLPLVGPNANNGLDAQNYGVKDAVIPFALNRNGGGAGALGNNNPMAEALANNYQRDLNSNVNAITNRNAVNAPLVESNNQLRAANMMTAEQQNINQNYLQQYDYQEKRKQLYQEWVNNNQNATYGWISSILGGVTRTIGLGAAAAAHGA